MNELYNHGLIFNIPKEKQTIDPQMTLNPVCAVDPVHRSNLIRLFLLPNLDQANPDRVWRSDIFVFSRFRLPRVCTVELF